MSRDDAPSRPRAAGQTGDPLGVFRHAELPPWALVHRSFDRAEVGDVRAAVQAAIARVEDAIPPNGRICVAIGSRGIDRIAEVAAATVAALRAAGADVFAIPAMGSHGGATAEGQVAVLASLGVTAERIGCDIRASMDTVKLGDVDGIPVFIDRIAVTEADAIVPINRVKAHTDFSGEIESGLQKMIAIGLGKQLGADTFHARGFDSFATLIPAVAAHVLGHAPIPFGLALVENGYARLSRIEAVRAADIPSRERELKREADTNLARLPFDRLDLLIVDRIGKDVSGLGMDSNVVGRYYNGPTGQPPSIQRIYVRDLTDETEGNAVGIGMADVVHRRAVERMDAVKTYMNCVTAKTPEGARIAITVASDRQGIDLALAACLRIDAATARIARIADTKHLEWFFASEPLLAELRQRADCAITGDASEMGFDPEGNLLDRLPS